MHLPSRILSARVAPYTIPTTTIYPSVRFPTPILCPVTCTHSHHLPPFVRHPTRLPFAHLWVTTPVSGNSRYKAIHCVYRAVDVIAEPLSFVLPSSKKSGRWWRFQRERRKDDFFRRPRGFRDRAVEARCSARVFKADEYFCYAITFKLCNDNDSACRLCSDLYTIHSLYVHRETLNLRGSWLPFISSFNRLLKRVPLLTEYSVCLEWKPLNVITHTRPDADLRTTSTRRTGCEII